MFNLKTYLAHHRHALAQSLENLRRTPVVTALTIAVLSISFLLPIVFWVLLENMQPVIKNFDKGNHIALYLKQTITASQGQNLADTLKNRSDLSEVNFISSEQGRRDFSDVSGLADAFAALAVNPLPGMIEVKPIDTHPDALTQLQTELSQLPEVDLLKVDMQWIKRLFAIFDLTQQFIYGLSVILGVAILLIIGNMIRGIVQAHRSEILVLKLVGASGHFIRRPFIYTGMMYGFIAGLLALCLSACFIYWLNVPVQTLAALYNSSIELHGLGFGQIVMLLMISLLLGAFGAWAALTEHLLDVEVRA
jgi:cell division transport system permease protein